MKDDQPILLIECKHWKQDLNLHDNQLLRYFNVSKAKFGLLTNGIIYRFYTDLKEPNIMDDKPFLEVDITDLRDNQIEELKKFHKSYFDVGNILNSASELKYMGELKAIIQEEFSSPSTDFVKMFATKVYEGRMLQNIIDQFTPLVKRAISSHINDIINERLKGALTVSDSKLSRLNRSKLTLRLKKLKQKNNQNQKLLLQKKNLMLIVSLRQSVGKSGNISYSIS